MSGKTKKAMLKRIKITAKGKLIHRRTRQNHFNSKDRGKRTMLKRHSVDVARTDAGIIKSLLS